MIRLWQFRLVLALIGTAVLGAGLLLEAAWLAGAGLAFLAGTELVGIAQIRVPAATPSWRLVQGASEALPSIGIALMLPPAMLVATALIVRALLAGGIETVILSRGGNGTVPDDTARRILACMANLLLLPAALLGLYPGLNLGGTFADQWLLSAIAVAILGSIWGLAGDWLWLRRR